jgi:UV DNA damage endonuclease
MAQTTAKNLDDLEAILQWMEPRGLRLFRIGSSLVPFASHEQVTWDWADCCAERLAAVGKKYASRGFRFSLHPGQYTLLGSPDAAVAARSLAEFQYACRVLDLMGLDDEHKIVLHAGGVYGDRAASVARLVAAIENLPAEQLARLVLENDEGQYHLGDIVTICETTGASAVFDLHHHQLHPVEQLERWLARTAATWTTRPKVHLSSQMPSARAGTHDVLIRREDFDALAALLPFEADLMLEAKGKEKAALQVLGWINEGVTSRP